MKRILVAEDNDSNYMLMTYILRNHYEFFRAKNGQEAVDIAPVEKPDLILMDIKMPIKNGLQATTEIKALMPDIPIVALTANAFDSDRQAAIEAGCSDFLSKPINAARCLETLKELLGE